MRASSSFRLCDVIPTERVLAFPLWGLLSLGSLITVHVMDVIRRGKRRQDTCTYSAARKRPCMEPLETDSLEAPQSPDSTVNNDIEEENDEFGGQNELETLLRGSPLPTAGGDPDAPPPLIDLSLTPLQQGPAGKLRE